MKQPQPIIIVNPAKLDPEAVYDPTESSYINLFDDKKIRHAFIRKVYSILSIQLMVTLGIICIFIFVEEVNTYVRKNRTIFWVAFGLTFFCLIALICFGNLRRKFPLNYIFLGIFTVCEGILLGTISATFAIQEVLMAVSMTAIVVLVLTLFAFQTKIDFTIASGFLLISLVILVIFGVFTIIFRNKILSIVYSSIAALLFCFYLLYDTQLLIGGGHKYAISPEEYIFAALSLYLDIIMLFMQILSLIGLTRS